MLYNEILGSSRGMTQGILDRILDGISAMTEF